MVENHLYLLARKIYLLYLMKVAASNKDVKR
jgi:hypothetical protein